MSIAWPHDVPSWCSVSFFSDRGDEMLSSRARFAATVTFTLLQVISAEAMGALFFSSSAPTPDSDPKCSPPSDAWQKGLLVGG